MGHVFLYIVGGIFALFLIVWGISEIQIRVWMRYGERFLLHKSNKLKKKENEEIKK